MSNSDHGTSRARNWSERMAEDSYQDTRMINNTEALLNARVNAKLNLEYRKIELRQREQEAKRGIYEDIAFDEEGRLYMITRNLWIDTKPREFANLRYPKLARVARKSCLEEYAFIIDCKVNEKSRMIYLDPKKIGSGTYLLGKMAAAGICIQAPEKKAKQYARLMLSWLMRNAEDLVIADEPGWIEIDGDFLFIPEGNMTWREIKKLL